MLRCPAMTSAPIRAYGWVVGELLARRVGNEHPAILG